MVARQLTIQTVTTTAGLRELETDWNDLLTRADVPHPFLTHEWVRTWWDCFAQDARLHIVVARDGDRPVAIAPLMRDTVWRYGLRVRRLRLLCNDHTPRFDFLAESQEACQALWQHLASPAQARWDVLQLRQISATSAAGLEMQRMARAHGHRCGRWPASVSPFVTLHGSWDEYFASRSYQHRKKIRAKFRHLREIGPFELETITGGDRLAGALESGLAIEAAAWKERTGTAIRSNAGVSTFYARLAERAAAHGWLELQFLRVNGQRIAFAYDLRYRQRLFRLKIGYDPAHGRCSPSQLLCALTLERAFAEGLVECDFLGEDEPWKRAWATGDRPHEWLFICPPRLRPRLFHYAKFRLTPWLKQHRLSSVSHLPSSVPAGSRASSL
jgi:CelD/BcsL family acetyltransferase involved in cellulose biosynthesis